MPGMSGGLAPGSFSGAGPLSGCCLVGSTNFLAFDGTHLLVSGRVETTDLEEPCRMINETIKLYGSSHSARKPNAQN